MGETGGVGLRVEVVVVVVAVRLPGPQPGRDGAAVPGGPEDPSRAALLGMSHKRAWPSQPADGRPPLLQARELAAALVWPSPAEDGIWSDPVPVGFVEPADDPGAVHLVYTVAGGVSAAEVAPRAGLRWTDLGTAAGRAGMEEVRSLVAHHWRGAVAETSAALDLLPRYFTMGQLHAVYCAVWNRPLDRGNFQRWAGRLEPGIVETVPATTVDSEREARERRGRELLAAAAGSGSPGRPGTDTADASRSDPLGDHLLDVSVEAPLLPAPHLDILEHVHLTRTVGSIVGGRASRAGLAQITAAGRFGTAVDAAASAARQAIAAVAHPRSGRGAPPQWYRRTGAEVRPLRDPFPRPGRRRSKG